MIFLSRFALYERWIIPKVLYIAADPAPCSNAVWFTFLGKGMSFKYYFYGKNRWQWGWLK